ncbi:MAG: flagellar hook-associated protein FlgK [Alphaproteobacteria bacterium]|nr:flagellar hook-associated protein FlgK [Alphaproteobacteria bacterium]MBV9692538.1 flagellar hook-associated protein FlgK [Alphaproteobacteria bacterium]
MSLNGILSNALSALQTNTEALRVTSGNIANINTQGYARRVVNLQTQSAGGALGGVDIASVERAIDQYLAKETLAAGGASARYDAQTSIFGQLNGILGAPGDGTALTSQLTNVGTALGQAVQSPSSSASQLGALNAFQSLASQFSSLSASIKGLRDQADQQISAAVTQANSLIGQIHQLNIQAMQAAASGSGDSAALDQRDQAIQSLGQLIGIKVAPQSDGSITVMTEDGTTLVGSTTAELSYSGGAGTSGLYPAITLASVDPNTGKTVGTAQTFDPHIASGQIKGLVEMRDSTLANAAAQLGVLARQTALAYNAQHNANTAFPPPASLQGRNTGLLAGDALNFSGKTTLAVSDPNGDLVSRIDVDFAAGTISVDGGAPSSFTQTVGGFTAALNSALGSNGTASFANGVLSLSAAGGNGLAIKDAAAAPANRGGSGFSQFFGLNDLFSSATPSILSTGLSASDLSGLAAGGTMSLVLKNPNGGIVRQANVTVTAGMTIGDVVSALNTAMGGTCSFSLNADGSLTTASADPANALVVSSDSTARGSTGMSFSTLFGLGTQQTMNFAAGFAVNAQVAANPQRLAFAQANIDSTTVAGDGIVGHGDASGALALQNLATATQSFPAGGGGAARNATLGDYAASFYQGLALESRTATSNQTAQDDRLQEAQSRQSQVSGVSLDEELTNMTTYQQAYSASARVLNVVQQLFDTLMQIQ